MNNGLLYIPKFVRQVSDLEYGSTVTHENYNEKLNLNTEQGDYNTEVLRHLFSVMNPDDTYHIAYLDKKFDDEQARVNAKFEEQEETITDAVNVVESVVENVSANTTSIANIINGVTKIGKASTADAITGVANAGVHKYYGTDYNNVVGFHSVPDNLSARDIGSSAIEVSGIYFTPRENSVTEDMMVDAVKAKLNRTSISSYPDLSNLPSINNVELVGNKTLANLGIQPAGNYLTEVPANYTAAMQDYVDDSVAPKLDSTTAANTYATIQALQNLSNTVNSLSTSVASTYARVFVQSSQPSNAKTGDIWVNV